MRVDAAVHRAEIVAAASTVLAPCADAIDARRRSPGFGNSALDRQSRRPGPTKVRRRRRSCPDVVATHRRSDTCLCARGVPAEQNWNPIAAS
jgi:hypothetical protein